MGANIVRRLIRKGHSCVVFDNNSAAVAALEKEGAAGARSIEEFVGKLAKPRAAWVMVPAGVTEAVIQSLAQRLERDDVIIDGGNSYFRDDRRRAEALAPKGIHYMDVGTSGGVWGLERGYCLMIGAEPEVMKRLEPILAAIAPGRGDVPRTPGREKLGGTAEQGYLHCGPPGAGHFVKMVHNGVEYGIMAAFAEGFDILKNGDVHTREVTVDAETAPHRGRDLVYKINVADVAEVWRRGSVVGAWLLDLAAQALAESPDLAEYSGRVADSGEGRWTVETAIEEAVPAEVLTSALYARFRSRQDHTFAEKVCSAMRFKFGGHVERPTGG
jgi:6-phosphogluconate dehydrogenase